MTPPPVEEINEDTRISLSTKNVIYIVVSLTMAVSAILGVYYTNKADVKDVQDASEKQYQELKGTLRFYEWRLRQDSTSIELIKQKLQEIEQKK